MSRKVMIKYHRDRDPFEFEVGKFVTIQHHFKSDRLLPAQLLSWINDLADKGLIFHSEYDNRFIFRVDGAVIDQLKEEIELSSETRSEYTGCNMDGSMYTDSTTLYLNIDGTCISEVSLS